MPTRQPATKERADVFGRWLAARLEERRMRSGRFARRIGMPPPSVYNWLDGRTLPAPASCIAIAHGLGIEAAEVLALADHADIAEALAPGDVDDEAAAAIAGVRWTAERIAELKAMADRWRADDAEERTAR